MCIKLTLKTNKQKHQANSPTNKHKTKAHAQKVKKAIKKYKKSNHSIYNFLNNTLQTPT
jgi:hypothetical protein